MKSSVKYILPLLALSTAIPQTASATGGWVPERWLDDGGKRLQGSPEFFWDIELTRLAGQYADKDLPFKLKPASPNDDYSTVRLTTTAVADIEDFEDALKSERLKSVDPAGARNAHKMMREWLNAGAKAELPDVVEADSEFADYHKAAALFTQSKPAEAKAIWEKLLLRPAEQRHYRSVWAAFMLGKCCMGDAATRAEAISWFEKCRQFAREGFADSEGLAADSIGWQGGAEYHSGNFPVATRLFLQQLALGDRSAIASLKRVVNHPNLQLSPIPEQAPAPSAVSPTEDQQAEMPNGATQRMAVAAKDPVLRQIITAYILANTTMNYAPDDAHTRLSSWLNAVNHAGLTNVEGAASLGWVAYTAGRYADAEKWLKLDQPATPLGQWLRAKLAMRNGAFTEASRIMKSVVPALPAGPRGIHYGDGYHPRSVAAADLGASLLALGKFRESLDAFLSSGCWEDAAYVAESVLTTNELVQFVKTKATLTPEERSRIKHYQFSFYNDVESGAAGVHPLMKEKLMNLTGRKLIREGRISEGRLLLHPSIRKNFDKYQALLATGNHGKTPKLERAKAMFTAARLMRRRGVYWRGPENDVVRFDLGGYAPDHPEEIIHARLTGQARINPYQGDGDMNQWKKIPLFIPSTPPERKRLRQSSVQLPMYQHVRLASALAVKAAALLPDNTEETADVLNQAGRWIQDIDNPRADKIYFKIEQRCDKTTIGAAVIARHWFIDPNGPWTNEPEAPEEPEAPDAVEPTLPE